jgi:2-methylisoborneol synthase
VAVLARALDEAIAEVYDGCDVPDAALPSRPDPARAAATADAGAVAAPALLSAMAGLSALPASPYQVERVRREVEALSAAAPGRAAIRPPWEYLSLGHVNAYSPALAALDAVDGFELSPSSAADPELRRAQRLAALAAALLHDIAAPSPSGLTAAIARADALGPGAAGRRAAEVHDEAMRAFQYHATHLASSADPATRRYLSGLWTWLGGHRTWHAVS